MNKFEIVDEIENDDYEIEDQDYSERYPVHLFDKISQNMYKNKSNNMLHIPDVPITSETKHRYEWYKIENNLKAQGIDTSQYKKNKYDIVYVGNPIEEVDKALPALTGMQFIKKHSKIDVANGSKKDLYAGHLTNVQIKNVKNRETAVAEQLIVYDDKSINDIIKTNKRGVSAHWNGKFIPIETSIYKDKIFYSNRYKDKVVEFVKVDLEPNNLSHVMRQNDELCVIQDEDINNQREEIMSENKSLAEKLINSLTSAINSVFSSSEIADEDTKNLEINIDQEKDKIDKNADEDIDEKKEIQDADILNKISELNNKISIVEKENETLKNSLKEFQEIADQDTESNDVINFINGLGLGSRSQEIIKDSKLSSSNKLNKIAKTFDLEIADEDLDVMDIASKKMLIKTLHKGYKNKITNVAIKNNSSNSSTLNDRSDEILKNRGM